MGPRPDEAELQAYVDKQVDDERRAQIEAWLAEFERAFPDKEGVPMLNTAHPDLPPRFALP